MRTEARPRCPLCASSGRLLYEEVGDPLFGVAGSWRLVRCNNALCRLLWQNPMVVAEDIHRAYARYYTHRADAWPAGPSPAERLYAAAFDFLDRRHVRLTHLAQERRLAGNGYLDGLPPGRLLDVGCGSGEFLHKLRGRGWQVAGSEIDAEAVRIAAARYGIEVAQGKLQAAGFSPASFDAVTVRHVVEHLHDPAALLRQCWRLLRPGGRLVAVTPNAESLGHAVYGRHWRGLEQPRHLCIHTADSLAELARLGGVAPASVRSTAQGMAYLLQDSERIRCGRRRDLKSWWNVLAAFWWWQRKETALVARGIPAGEELVLIAEKP